MQTLCKMEKCALLSVVVLSSCVLCAHAQCAWDDILGHNWTYIAAPAFSGGSWSAEHECVYYFEPKLKLDDLHHRAFVFRKPPSCVSETFDYVHGILFPNGTVDLTYYFHNSTRGGLEAPQDRAVHDRGLLAASCSNTVTMGAAVAASVAVGAPAFHSRVDGHAFIDMASGGMYVRGYGSGRDHPMDFAHHEWLRVASAWVVRSAMITFPDGTQHITPGIPVSPGALPHYDGQYLRDGYYGIAHGWALVNETMQRSFRESVSWMLGRARQPDGVFPLSCHVNGRCFIAENCDGYAQPIDTGCQDLDSAPFATMTAAYIWRYSCTTQSERNAWYDLWGASLELSLNSTTKMPGNSAVVWSNVSRPMVGYGFQDNEVKSGVVLYSNVLYWNASLLLADMAAERGDALMARRLNDKAAILRDTVNAHLWNERAGVFMASTGYEADNIDIWANAAAAASGFANTSQRSRIAAYMISHADQIFFDGQVRQVPFPSQWSDRSTSRVRDPQSTIRTYQNGGYWATPHHHMLPFLAMHNRSMACALLNATIRSFRSYGIWEWIGPFFPAPSRGAPGYTASAVNTYFASENMRCWEG